MMTRKEYELICRVLKECRSKHLESDNEGTVTIPSAEWMRRKITIALANAFMPKCNAARSQFLRAAGVSEDVTATVPGGGFSIRLPGATVGRGAN